MPRVGAIIAFLIVAPIILLVGAVFLGEIAVVTSTAGSAEVTQTTGQTVQLADIATVGSLTATLTQGNALYFDGSDDNLTAPTASAVDSGNWTLAVYAELNTSGTNADAAYNVLAYNNSSIVLNYDDGQWLGYYNDSTQSTVVTVDAPNPGQGALLTLRYNGSELRLARNETDVNASALSAGISGRNLSHDWVGTIDEVRAFGNAVPTSRLASWENEPAIPLEGQTRLARYLFDEGNGNTAQAYFVNTDVDVTGAEWVSGIAGPGLDRHDDYTFSTAPLEFTVLTSGTANGAPVVFVSWGANSGVGSIITGFEDAVGLFVAAMMVASAAIIISQLNNDL